ASASSPTPSKTPAVPTPPSSLTAASRPSTHAAAGWSICCCNKDKADGRRHLGNDRRAPEDAGLVARAGGRDPHQARAAETASVRLRLLPAPLGPYAERRLPPGRRDQRAPRRRADRQGGTGCGAGGARD